MPSSPSTKPHPRQIDASRWEALERVRAEPARRVSVRTTTRLRVDSAATTAQNQDGSWSQLPGVRLSLCTGEALYALHVSGSVPANDARLPEGCAVVAAESTRSGSWFAPTRAVPVQPHTFESFPNGWHQFVSDAASCWATMALPLRCGQASLEQLISSNLSATPGSPPARPGSSTPKNRRGRELPRDLKDVMLIGRRPGPNVSYRPKRGAAMMRASYGIALEACCC